MKILYFLGVFCLWPAITFSQEYEINISLKSNNDTVVLGHYFAKSDLLISDDTVVLKNGKGVFKGSKELAKGIYFIYNDNKKFDIVMGDHKKFGIMSDTTDFLKHTRFTGSPENDVFYEFQRYNADRSVQFSQLNEQWQKATDAEEKNEIRTRMQVLNEERVAFIRELINNNKELYVSKFLNALVPVEVPDPPAGTPQDSVNLYRYRWYRAHFFDNLDIYDPDMLRTPFYEDKVKEYLTRVIPQHPDTICVEADKILARAQANDEIFRCILVSVFNYYVQSKVMVHENVWVHLADKWYIPYAIWSTEDYLDKLKAEVEKKKPNLIGKYAPPMEIVALPPEHFKAAALDTAIKHDLYAGVRIEDYRKSVKGKYTAILFWDYSCSHCKKTILDLHKVYEEYASKGLRVITVQTVNTKEAKGKWIDLVNENNLFGWTNAWSPYTNEWRDLYDVSMTPIIYLLDEKEDIIAKRIGPEQIKEFITNQ